MGRVGETLRARYVQEKEGAVTATQYLPHVMRPSDIYLRSTDIKRTCTFGWGSLGEGTLFSW